MESYDFVKNFIRKESQIWMETSEESSTSDASKGRGTAVAHAQVQTSNCNVNIPTSNASPPDQLVSVLTERNANVNNGNRRTKRQQISLEPKGGVLRTEELSINYMQVQVHPQNPIDRNHAAGKCASNVPGKQKIPRPANAFMLFANEWRKKLALQNPRESNKDISVRLGVLWKNMSKDVKEKYFALSREVDAEHKRKYPDYVYNPKEARMRKAMREQSRELSRQTILQTAIASATGSATGAGPGGNEVENMGISSSGNFSNHPMVCASPTAAAVAAASSLPGSPSINANRIISPWFPVGHGAATNHLKPILMPRVMGAHRTLDKTKEVIRKQVECAALGGFPGSGYGDFVPHEAAASANSNTIQEGNDYCVISEFLDGQKWHPYQSGTNAYHFRGGPMSKINNLHRNLPNPHPGHWTHFCGVPLPQNAMMRSPRHVIFLQEQQNQHCVFSEEIQYPYGSNKIDINHRLHVSYPQLEHQQEKLSLSSPLSISQLQDEGRCVNETSSWSSSTSTSGASESSISNSLVASSSRQELESYQKEDQENDQEESSQHSQQYMERAEQQEMSLKQPLPGFHQAFGSTEIGRFSRSEFFASMVGENSNLIPENFLSTPGFPFVPKLQNFIGNSTLLQGRTDEENLQQILSEDCFWLAPEIPVSSIPESAPHYAPFLDYSRRARQEWLISQDLNIEFLDQSPAFVFYNENDKVDSRNNCISCTCVKLNTKEEDSTSSCDTSDSEGLDLRFLENLRSLKDESDEDL